MPIWRGCEDYPSIRLGTGVAVTGTRIAQLRLIVSRPLTVWYPEGRSWNWNREYRARLMGHRPKFAEYAEYIRVLRAC